MTSRGCGLYRKPRIAPNERPDISATTRRIFTPTVRLTVAVVTDPTTGPSQISVKVIKKTFSDEYHPSPEKLLEQLAARVEGTRNHWDSVSKSSFTQEKALPEASYYEPIVEKMMQSFRYRPNRNR